MKVFVTGAAGFIGRAYVEAALGAGHDVVALVRRDGDAARLGWVDRPGLDVAVGDVRAPQTYAESLRDVEAVCHLAASFGAFAEQFSVNVVGTERLLEAMVSAGVSRLVLVSSFSLYDYRAVPAGSVITESSPLEARPEDRDPYTQTKLEQEALTRTTCAEHDIDLTVVRPGAVFGPGNTWGAGAAVSFGSLGLAFAPRASSKLTTVENCAAALVLALADEAIGATVNVVDDDPPSPLGLNKALRDHGVAAPRLVPVPYAVVHRFAQLLDAGNRRFLGGRAKLPAIVVPAKLDAMYKPFTYPNDEAKAVLGWKPQPWVDTVGALESGTERP